MQEAIDRFANRLRGRLTEYADRLRTRRQDNQEPEPGQWRRTDIPVDRPQYFDRPADERELVRRKSFAAPFSTPEEALFDMEALDHDLFLFTSAESGEPNVIFRTSDGDYELIEHAPRPGGPEVGNAPIRRNDQVPGTISSREALTALNLGDQPFVFFIDADGGEAAVMYRRYDGHYGLITLDRTG